MTTVDAAALARKLMRRCNVLRDELALTEGDLAVAVAEASRARGEVEAARSLIAWTRRVHDADEETGDWFVSALGLDEALGVES